MPTVLPNDPSRVFFPWERRRGLLGFFGPRRARLAFSVLGGGLLVALLYERGEREADVRATREAIATTSRATVAYRADHGGACPPRLSDLVPLGYLRDEQLDAWGHPLRLTCPGRKDPRGFDLSSDGPDGLPGGLDEVE